MERVRGRRSLKENGIRSLSAAFLAGSLVLAGCGGEGDKGESASTTQAPTSAEAPTSSASTSVNGEQPTLVFDDLGGGSSIIQVYPGVTESARDRQSNGTFNDGERVLAECKAEGRIVRSQPSLGEEDRTSNDWVRIHGTPGATQFATAVYAKNPDDLLKQLPDC